MKASRFFATIIFVLAPFFSSAQDNYEAGYMVSKTGDTISGWINFKDWSTGPFVVEFKSDLSLPPVKLYPITILGFSVHNMTFRSMHVVEDISPDDKFALLKGPERKLKEADIFAQVLISSSSGLNLYYHADESTKEHYFSNEGNTLRELREIKYLDSTGFYIMAVQEWFITLMFLTGSCPDVLQDYSENDFSRQSLLEIIASYNECMERDYEILIDEEDEKKFLFGVMGGFSSAKIVYHSDMGGNYYTTADYSSGSGITAGVFYDIDLPHQRETWWLSGNFLIHKFQSTGIDNSETSLNLEHHEITFEQLDFKFIASLKYQTNTQPFRGYIKAGPVISKSLQSSNQTISVTTNKFTEESDSATIDNEIQKNSFHFGGIIQTGLNWNNRLFLDIGFERGFYLEDYAGVDSFENDLYISLYFALN